MGEVFIFFQIANYGNPSESLKSSLKGVVCSVFSVLASMSINSACGLTQRIVIYLSENDPAD